MKTLKDFSFKGKRALIRVDFNVPLNTTKEVTDATRIEAALPTISYILRQGGSVVLMSHLGRPSGGYEADYSLSHIVSTLSGLLGKAVEFAGDCIGEQSYSVTNNLGEGKVVLLENLRFHNEEKKGDSAFAEKLSKHGDIYINDAFGTAHRAHASTAIIASFFEGNSCFGLLMQKELESVRKVMQNSAKPFTAIIGGAKVSSKISIIQNLMDKLDNLIIGGGMSYTFVKAMGGRVGDSLVEDKYLEEAKAILNIAEDKGVRILIPEDSIIADAFDNNANRKTVDSSEIPDGWMGLDIGANAIEHYTKCIEESKTILWNGPMGVFEMDNFQAGTKKVAYSVVSATERGAYSLVGGGDSVAAINKYDLKEHVSYVSTGGGALLELIEGKELPGVAAIENF
ncbi:MAG: phosphoglycerate kinase [Crocinitomicaceae bacterium]|jgi:phosphoglycerate kinase|nr:phosphoglycerate kinase [Crocinitomicaceae bacterium]|tara:strand:+ start:68469 stop:69662 length:1194 start_codon:yes stop_codon:yes gene_type:complete